MFTVYGRRIGRHSDVNAVALAQEYVTLYGEVQQIACQVLGCAWLHLQLYLLLRDLRITFGFAVVISVGMDSHLSLWNNEFLQRSSMLESVHSC